MKYRETNSIQKIKNMGIWILLIVVFISELLFYTWSRVQCIRIGYDISSEKDRYQKLIVMQNNLNIEFEHLKSPARLSQIAKNNFNLEQPTSEQITVFP